MNSIQLSVFLENKRGRLAEVTKVLADNEINIRALFIADTSDFGILRMIVDDTKKALSVLKENNFTVRENEVVAVEVEDKPGGLSQILGILDASNLNVEYLYCFTDRSRNIAIDIMRVEDVDRAIEVLRKADVKVLGEKEFSRI